MLLAILPNLTALGYGVLFVRLAQTRSIYLCPFFALYCLSLTLYYPLWDARSEWQMVVQMFILGLRFCAAVEALMLAMESIGVRERRLLAGLVAIALAIGWWPLWAQDFNYGAGQLNQYRTIHQTVNVAVGLGCMAGVGYFWIDPPKTRDPLRFHGCIFTALVVGHAVCGFVKPWKLGSALFFLISLGCIGMWLWRGLLVQPFNLPLDVANPGVKL